MKYHTTYKKHEIYKNETGHVLPWLSYVNGLFVYADTLTGIKKLITNGVENEKNY